jgi:hypothetical protein
MSTEVLGVYDEHIFLMDDRLMIDAFTGHPVSPIGHQMLVHWFESWTASGMPDSHETNVNTGLQIYLLTYEAEFRRLYLSVIPSARSR